MTMQERKTVSSWICLWICCWICCTCEKFANWNSPTPLRARALAAKTAVGMVRVPPEAAVSTRPPVAAKTRWFSPLRIDVFQLSNQSFFLNETNYKRSSSITIHKQPFLQLIGLAVSDNQWEQSKDYNRLCCQQNYLRIKLYIYILPLVEFHSHWQQCIASLSTISLEKINACYIQSLFPTLQH